jgi:hypothetical protein
MRLVFITALALASGPGAFSQHSASPGFPSVNNSNILHPGVPPGGAPTAQRPYSRGGAGGVRRYYGGGTVYVPYPGYIDPFYATEPGYDPNYSPPSPVVIINQNFQPETLHPQIRDYTNVPLPEPGVTIPAPGGPAPAANDQQQNDQQPNMFLIAMKDQSVVPALAYWVQDDTLNYITLKGVQNHVSMSLVDRELSTRLNGERQVQFRLPAVR